MPYKIFAKFSCGYYAAVIGSLLLSLIINMWRVPWFLLWVWPLWTLIWLLGWSYYSRRSLHVSMVWFAGCMTDLLTGSLLGFHVLLYLLIYYVILAQQWKMQRVMVLPQPLLVFLLILFYVFAEQLVLTHMAGSFFGLQYLVKSAITFAVCSVFFAGLGLGSSDVNNKSYINTRI